MLRAQQCVGEERVGGKNKESLAKGNGRRTAGVGLCSGVPAHECPSASGTRLVTSASGHRRTPPQPLMQAPQVNINAVDSRRVTWAANNFRALAAGTPL